MQSMSLRRTPARIAVLLAAALAATAAAATAAPQSINEEIRADMQEARREIRVEFAAARAELADGNLELNQSMPVGRRKAEAKDSPPKGEITPAGDLLVDGRAVQVDADQRRQLQAYRAEVIELALLGIDAGERAAEAAIDAVDHGLFRLMFDAVTGRLERRVERTVKRTLAPQIQQICHRLPDLLESQQRLADSVPAFRPYATLRQRDVEDCNREVRRELARAGARQTRRGGTG
ncbi:hypothetical protein [Luteimonas sp. J29]|uniref:hypothetical protein n=1 Tax=Luteimonas sp. J29 TaxID=935863 RepID=UPI0004BA3DD8|nr:hypothetical protein [Luteimonas sp. J29]